MWRKHRRITALFIKTVSEGIAVLMDSGPSTSNKLYPDKPVESRLRKHQGKSFELGASQGSSSFSLMFQQWYLDKYFPTQHGRIQFRPDCHGVATPS